MKRRSVVGGLVSLSLAGCLRLTDSGGTATNTGASASIETASRTTAATSTNADAASTESSVEATREPGVYAKVVEAPEPFVLGRTQRIAVRVENDRDVEFDGEIELRLDGELRAIESVTLRSRTAATVAFDLTVESLETHSMRLVVTGASTEEVLVDGSLPPARHAVTVDWGASYVPSDDPDSDSTDDRRLAFYCRELVLERAGEAIETYDVGVIEDEPRRLEGTYDPEENDGEKWRWFGGPEQRTVVGFEEGLLANADALRFVGHVSPEPDEMPVTAEVGDRQTDQRTWTESTDEYVVSIAVDQ
ncbi:hypothetical protein G9C85_03290 [Halorubellus sp. JP-L1]|uniref:hypothetical protein n=1 Tax=Halorubellus sp. JP-L1 TaxID=2715753 RepID=UPI00140E0788|nr:hypothetical protein [Halorubellus sp. JP-L1]NHN40661.1 hypothetical protein [Halorubellus sp. JP-L1]